MQDFRESHDGNTEDTKLVRLKRISVVLWKPPIVFFLAGVVLILAAAGVAMLLGHRVQTGR